MSIYGVQPEPLTVAARDWQSLADLMGKTSSDLSGASVAGLAPSVQGAATAFLTAWSGYAGESEAIASGFSTALEQVIADGFATDREIDSAFGGLDARLGPAR